MAIIKESPEDFIVEEIANHIPKEGRYTICILKKRDYTTEKAVELIARVLHLQRKDIGYAGLKDRKAITTQYISIKANKERIQELKFDSIEVEYLHQSNEPIHLGMLEQNKFTITLRQISEEEKTAIKNNLNKQIINLFGPQRFSKNNAEVGYHLIKKEFKEACNIITQNNGEYEIKVKESLQQSPTECINALRTIPKRILSLYVSAFQSELWNKAAIILSETTKENFKIPIVGFGTEWNNKIIENTYKTLLKEYNITERDFIIRQFPEISVEGTERELYVCPEIKIIKEEKETVTITFNLPKASYATTVITQLTQP